MQTIKSKILITNKLGLHARAAAKFVKLSSQLKSKVIVRKGKKNVNGLSILGLMTLAASKGSEILISCTGKYAKSDLNVLLELVRGNFYEEDQLPKSDFKEKIYKGIGVSPGVIIGCCKIKEQLSLVFPNYKIKPKEIPIEIKRLKTATENSISELKSLIKRNDSNEYFGHKAMGSILEAHISMLESSSLIDDSSKSIKNNLINAEVAISEELKKHELVFKRIKDQYLKERFEDVKDVCKRLINNLKRNKRSYKKNFSLNKEIILSEDLSAADLLSFKKDTIIGLVSEAGGPEGHFAIVARSLSIPTIVGVKNLLKDIRNGEKIILDGNNGILIRNPSIINLKKYENKIDDQKTESMNLNSFKKIIPNTKDKKRIYLEANVDNSEEVKNSLDKGIDGIGLFRSEYLYMKRKTIPTEQEQFNFIKNSLHKLGKKVLTIRTLDIGNDKHVEFIDKLINPSPNPALGLRAIRLTLAFPKIFEKQISAILRASDFGNIRIMLPMVSNVSELKEAKKIIEKVNQKLINSKKKKKTRVPPLGVLIETPAAALIADSLAENCDFLAIGTNDLTMYTLAIDRGDESVAKIYDPAHLSVLKLIKMTNDAGKKANIPVSVCGEIAGDTFYTALLIGMNIKILSMSTSRILKIKQLISILSFKDSKKLADSIMLENNNEKVKNKLMNFNNNLRIT